MNVSEPLPPEPSQPTPVIVDVSNGGELANTLDIASIADWGPLSFSNDEPEHLH